MIGMAIYKGCYLIVIFFKQKIIYERTEQGAGFYEDS